MLNYFTFFYTHKFQNYNSNSFFNWVYIPSLYNVLPYQNNEPSLNLLYSLDQTLDNTISIETKGYLYTDCSLPITGDKPLVCSNLISLGSLNLNNVLTSSNVEINKTYNYIPNNNFNKLYPYFNNTLNKNFTYTTEKKLLDFSNVNSLFLKNVGYGSVSVKRYTGSTLNSYISDFPISKGLLPNSYLNNTYNDIIYNQCSLLEWGTSLLYLIKLKEDTLIVKSLNFISNLFEVIKSTYSKSYGLPSYLNEDLLNQSNLLKERVVKDNVWAGFCIIQALSYLSNRPSNKVITINNKVKELLGSIVDLVKVCFLIQGLVLDKLDSYFVPTERSTFSTNLLTDIFLNQYLSLFFDADTFRIGAKLHSFNLNYFHLSYESIEPNKETVLCIYICKLYWVTYYSLDSSFYFKDYLYIKDNLEYLDLNKFSFEYYLWLYLYNYLEEITPNNLKVSSYSKDNINLYQTSIYTLEPVTLLKLETTSWLGLITESSLLYPITYNYKINEVLLLLNDSKLVATNTWPEGGSWGDSIVNNPSTVLGSIVDSFNKLNFDWFLNYVFITDGLACNTSQGSWLDYWGQVLNYPRPLYQSDYYYKETLALIMNKTKPVKDSIKKYLDVLIEDDVIIETSTNPLIYYRINNVWFSRPWVGNTDDINLINSQLNSEGKPSLYFPNENNTEFNLVPVSKVFGLYSIYSSNIDLNSYNLLINNLPTGLYPQVYKLFVFNDSFNTNTQFNLL